MNGITSTLAVSLFKDLLSSIAKKIPQAKEVLDKITEDPKLELELEKLAQERLKIELEREKIEQQDRMSARELAKVDVMSDNFLSKNIRPITLLVLLGIILVEVILRKDISPELKSLVEIVFVFYFGGRSAEKITALRAKSKIVARN